MEKRPGEELGQAHCDCDCDCDGDCDGDGDGDCDSDVDGDCDCDWGVCWPNKFVKSSNSASGSFGVRPCTFWRYANCSNNNNKARTTAESGVKHQQQQGGRQRGERGVGGGRQECA